MRPACDAEIADQSIEDSSVQDEEIANIITLVYLQYAYTNGGIHIPYISPLIVPPICIVDCIVSYLLEWPLTTYDYCVAPKLCYYEHGVGVNASSLTNIATTSTCMHAANAI